MSLSTITWFHLSDWHVRETPDRTAQEVFRQLIADISKVSDEGFQATFILHTGDIAFSGQESEYKVARGYLDSVMRAARVKSEALFLVAGNHDVDDSKAIDAKSLEESNDEKTYTDGMR